MSNNNPCTKYKNPLERNGLSQSQRLLNALHEDYVKLDERSLTELINYSRNFAQHIKYFNLENTEQDDWVRFIENDGTALVATISITDTAGAYADFKATIDKIHHTASDSDKKDAFKTLLSKIGNIAFAIDDWFKRADDGLLLQHDISVNINGQLKDALTRLIAYDKGAYDYFVTTPADGSRYTGLDYNLLSSVWGTNLNSTLSDKRIYGDEHKLTALLSIELVGPDPGTTIQPGQAVDTSVQDAETALMNLFTTFIAVQERLVSNTDAYLDELFNNYPNHQAHYGLFLTFLKLFGYVQDQLNGLRKKHLDFYYRQVLQLKEKESVPDEVFLIFELAKGINETLLSKGTLLKGGKDAIGKDLFYALKNDLVVNNAKPVEFKNVFLDGDKDSFVVRAAPVANSVDGLGQATGSIAWPPFGDVITPLATVGFAIASPQLLLAEGERKITLTVILEGGIPAIELAQLSASNFIVQLTGSKGWLVSNGNTVNFENVSYSSNGFEQVLEFSISLSSLASPIVGYSKKLHKGNFETTWPIMQMLVAPDSNNACPYNLFSRLQVKEYSITVAVTGVVNLIVQNDDNVMDASRPFRPFSVRPKVGSNFYIGSTEIFQKKLTEANIYIEWQDVPDGHLGNYYNSYTKGLTNADFAARAKVLDNGEWKDIIQQKLIDIQKLAPVKQSDQTLKTMLVNYKQIVHPLPIANLKAQPLSLDYFDLSGISVPVNGGIIPMPAFPSADDADLNDPTPTAGTTVALGDNIAALSTELGLYLPEILALTPLSKNKFHPLLYKNTLSLFDDSDARMPNRIDLKSDGANVETIFEKEDNPQRQPDLQNVVSYKPGVKKGFMKLELDPQDFFHERQTPLISATLLSNAHAMTVNKDNEKDPTFTPLPIHPMPNEPYTPLIRHIRMDYKSTETIPVQSFSLATIHTIKANYKLRVEQFFHIHPFGHAEVYPATLVGEESITDSVPADLYVSKSLFPEFPVSGNIAFYEPLSDNSVSKSDPVPLLKQIVYPDGTVTLTPATDDSGTPLVSFAGNVNNSAERLFAEGTLYIGLEDLMLPQTISLLFRFMDKTEGTLDFPAISWSYLVNNRWVPFNVLSISEDTTQGFRRSGLVKLDIPADASNNNTILEPGLYWIKCSVYDNPTAFADLIGIYTQAVEADFTDQGNNDPDHLRTPLPALSITKLAEKNANIKSVTQPFASFGGKITEQDNDYFLRVAERLRHKNRAITIRDFEALVLENFPQVYRVKCINHRETVSENAPGNITVVIVPDTKENKNIENPYQVKADLNLLLDIRDFLSERCSPFARLNVISPEYQEVSTTFKVHFMPGFDAFFYKKRLNEELRDFISPWGNGDLSKLTFGGKMDPSVVVNFIEGREYVDYVEDFVFNNITPLDLDGELVGYLRNEVTEIIANNSASVLVTTLQHNIS